MNVRFVMRGLLVALPLAAIGSAAGFIALVFGGWFGPDLEPTPPPPSIQEPSGTMPAQPIAFEEWARYQGGDGGLTGSGFLLDVGDGQPVGVTTAHSLSIGDPGHALEEIEFRLNGQPAAVAEFDTFHGHPGVGRTGEDLTVDYVLVRPRQSPARRLIVSPDRRGAPQPGERVSLYSGLHGNPGVFEGTVQTVTRGAFWVLMDDFFNPGLMSGSPFVSQHTGQVVGMLIAGNARKGRLLLGAHPVGSVVERAEAADEFPAMPTYRR